MVEPFCFSEMHMGKDNLLEAFASLKIDAISLTKLLKKSFKKDESTHKMRILFKKIKAHIVLVRALGVENIQMSDTLRGYYQQIGLLRDAKIFRELCKKYTHENKLIMVLGNERVVKAKEVIKKYAYTIHVPRLAKEVEELTTNIVLNINSFDKKRVEAGLETFLEKTENLLQQLLASEVITNVGFHTIRKHMKKAMYLMTYMCLFDKIKYAPILKKYSSFADDLGSWNDVQLLVEQLKSMPWTGREEKIVNKISKKEQKLKKKLTKKLRMYFRVSPKQTSKDTERIADSTSETPSSDIKSIEEKISAEPIVYKTVGKIPGVKNKPVAAKNITQKSTILEPMSTSKDLSGTEEEQPTIKTPIKKVSPKKKSVSPAKKKVTNKPKSSTAPVAKTTTPIQKKKSLPSKKKPTIRKNPGSSSTKK